MFEGGIADMNYSVSNNAEYGEYVTGTEVINEQSREAMRNALKRINLVNMRKCSFKKVH